jgi:Ser/Thr protein kinase RdoA (MazF antagonist)
VLELHELSLEKQIECLTELASAALPCFAIPERSRLTLLNFRENAVFRVDHAASGTPYVIRVHRDGYQTRDSIRSELAWMRALRDAGVHTPASLAGVDGDTVQTVSVDAVPGPRHCDVLSWVEGAHLGTASGEETYRLLGETNARIHRQVKRWTSPPGFTRQAWDEDGMLGLDPLWGRFADLEALSAERRTLMRRASDLVLERVRRFGKGRDRFGLIHADFMPENVLVQNGVPYVIDFDDCGFGWFLYDPATTLAWSTADPEFERIGGAWLEGYRSVEPLPDADWRELPTFIMARFLVGLGWMHTRRETPMAQAFTSMIVELACAHAERFVEEAR